MTNDEYVRILENKYADLQRTVAEVRSILNDHLSAPLPGVPPMSYTLARKVLAVLDGGK